MILSALEVPRDDDGRVVGYQIGRAFALSEWAAQREQREYAELFRRLYARRWAAQKRARSPDECRAALRSWRKRNAARLREMERRRRRLRRTKNPRVCICQECGVVQTLSFGERKRKYCGRVCRNRANGRRRVRGYRGTTGRTRNVTLHADMMRLFASGARLTLAGVRAALPQHSPGSIATRLTAMLASGELCHDGKKKWRTYRASGPGAPHR